MLPDDIGPGTQHSFGAGAACLRCKEVGLLILLYDPTNQRANVRTSLLCCACHHPCTRPRLLLRGRQGLWQGIQGRQSWPAERVSAVLLCLTGKEVYLVGTTRRTVPQHTTPRHNTTTHAYAFDKPSLICVTQLPLLLLPAMPLSSMQLLQAEECPLDAGV